MTSEFPPTKSPNGSATESSLDDSVQRRSLIAALVVAAAIACIALVLLVLPATNRDPYTRQLIQQVVSGKTPPMPRFQPEPQAMADLLAYLNSLV